MSAPRWSGVVVVLLAGAALAQPEEKPRMQVPEPKREQAPAGDFLLVQVDYEVADQHRDRFAQAVPELVKFVAQVPRLQLQARWRTRSLAHAGIAQATLLYMTGFDATLRLSEAEKTNLGKYLRGGGFLFAEDIRHADATNGLDGKGAGTVGTPFDRQFKDLMRDPLVLGGDGDKWEKMPKGHPIYASFYDFPDGPPLGGAPGGNVFDLEMLRLRGRVAVVFSDLNISYYWGDPLADARERGLQFGANLVVFAMTQRLGR
ncbi:MAG: DUF4159 domain-containing protein [Candidatus Latescibacterota bacterium]